MLTLSVFQILVIESKKIKGVLYIKTLINEIIKKDKKIIKQDTKDKNIIYCDKLENALKESIIIENEYKKGIRKGYNNAKEMLKSILDS